MQLTIDAQKRDGKGKSFNTQLRHSGQVPAVIYGRDVEDTLDISVNTRQIRSLLKQGALNNVLVQLNLDSEKKSRNVLIKAAEIHPVNSELLHVDFHQVSPGDQVQVKIPIKLVGEAVGVERDGGIVDQPVRTLRVSCRADNIPKALEVDITEMEIGDTISVEDIPVASGVDVLAKSERTVASIQPPEEFDLTVTPAAGVETIEETVEEAMEKAAEEGEEVEGEELEGEEAEGVEGQPEEQPAG
ncbi:MAG: 50S ribosomal protein L25 [bacterium]